MVKTSTLFKKLSSYSTLASVAIAASQNSQGQVIYTKIKPYDTLTLKQSYMLDLNNDGVKDYKLQVTTFTEDAGISVRNFVDIQASGSNLIDFGTSSLSQDAKSLNYKSNIGSKANWKGNKAGMGSCTNFFNSAQGNVFAGKGDKYIGLKLKKNGSYYYGWVRVNVDTKCNQMIIKDYAYNATSGTSITAGAGESSGVDVINTSITDVTYYPNPAVNNVTINYTISVEATVSLELYDISGRKLQTILNNAHQLQGHNTISVDVSNLSSGVYFYRLTVNGQTYTQKLVVTR